MFKHVIMAVGPPGVDSTHAMGPPSVHDRGRWDRQRQTDNKIHRTLKLGNIGSETTERRWWAVEGSPRGQWLSSVGPPGVWQVHLASTTAIDACHQEVMKQTTCMHHMVLGIQGPSCEDQCETSSNMQ